jgi:RHS repeat-associated protein
MKHEGGTEVYFDDLKIELNAVPTALVVQENHYYPFGMGMKGLDYTAPSPNRENKFTFNGKEKQTELGLHQYDFHARNYDYQINRTTTLDPLAFINDDISGYSFLDNNPINTIDPTGMDGESILPQGTAYDQQKERDRKEMQNLTRNYRTVSYLWRNTPQNGTLQASNNGDGTLNFYSMQSLPSPEAGNLKDDWAETMGLWHVGTLRLPSYYNPIANAVRGGRDGYRPGEIIHSMLDGIGMIEGVGTFADLLNASMYAAEGRWGEAGLSMGASIPIVGNVFVGIKATQKSTRIVMQGVYDVTVSGAKYNGRYIGSSDDIIRRIKEHVSTSPSMIAKKQAKFSGHTITVNQIYAMPGSTEAQRMVMEQSVIEAIGLNNLLNKINVIAK